jgi:hypothetical protein
MTPRFVIQRLTRRRTERQGDFQRQQRQPAERYRLRFAHAVGDNRTHRVQLFALLWPQRPALNETLRSLLHLRHQLRHAPRVLARDFQRQQRQPAERYRLRFAHAVGDNRTHFNQFVQTWTTACSCLRCCGRSVRR